MKKYLITFVLISLIAIVFSKTSLAGGDKVRGDNGIGDTTQNCLNFDECPYGDYNP